LAKNYFMATIQKSRYKILTLLLWAILIYSGMALIYHIRWFIPYLVKNQSAVVPEKQVPLIWFIVQICNNSAFIYIGWQLIRLFRKYNLTGYFDKESLKVFNTTIVLCIVLAITGLYKQLPLISMKFILMNGIQQRVLQICSSDHLPCFLFYMSHSPCLYYWH
jgi:hypothetical protein